jgi:streptogramin lyase
MSRISGRSARLAAALVTLVTTGALAGVAAAPEAAAITTGFCSDASGVSVSVFHAAAATWYENLAFDGDGTMWVSNLFGNALERYDSSGRLLESVPVTAPGGLSMHAGRLYAASGDSATSLGEGSVVSLDPQNATVPPTVLVTDLPSANGLSTDSSGNVYVANTLGGGVLKIRPNGTLDSTWTNAAPIPTTNGVLVSGGTVYTDADLDVTSPVYAMPLSTPGSYHAVARLSLAITKELDDLTTAPDGDLYVAANADGQIIRVNPATGSSCVLVGGLVNPTSVRMPIDFGTDNPARTFYVTEEAGAILRINVPN